MKFSFVAFASLLTTDPIQGYQAPAKEEIFVDELGQPGSRQPFRTTKLTSMSHKITSFYLLYINITD
jgi:hypothetical protein